MKRFATNGIERRKCPLCGGEIEVSDLYQYARTFKLTKSGKISKRYTVRDCGSMEATIAGCECGAYWEIGDFDINSAGRFEDYKYKEAEE